MYYNGGPGVRPFAPVNAYGGGYRMGGPYMQDPMRSMSNGIGSLNREGGRPVGSFDVQPRMAGQTAVRPQAPFGFQGNPQPFAQQFMPQRQQQFMPQRQQQFMPPMMSNYYHPQFSPMGAGAGAFMQPMANPFGFQARQGAEYAMQQRPNYGPGAINAHHVRDAWSGQWGDVLSARARVNQ